jgi:3-oxoacyl-[acyl-carrier protein] reductase
MTGSLAAKVALVTGASQGIGEAIARAFAQAGASVVIASRTPALGQDIAGSIESHGGRAHYVQTDVSQRAQILRSVADTVGRFGRLDIVVHNAVTYLFRPLESLNEEELDFSLAVNLKAGFWVIQAALPHLRKQGGGRFLFTSSVTGPRVAMAGTSPYAASKGGLNGLIKTAALEYARENITVNGVEPGFIRTPAAETWDKELLAQVASGIPLGSLGEPNDIAQAMLFLASDEARYITGQTLVIDGGSTLPDSSPVLSSFYASRSR